MKKARNFLLVSELIVLFIVLPLLYYFDLILGYKSVPLLIVFVYCLVILLRDRQFDRSALFSIRTPYNRLIVIRFALVALLIFGYMTIFESANLFVLVRQRPLLWIAIMVFYPVWSALPQEVIFRVFFFHRYRNLFPGNQIAMVVNVLLFAYLHLIFRNWVALAGSLFVGYLWASTYLRTRSLLVVGIEHAMYGNFIYTVGLGHYFYLPDF